MNINCNFVYGQSGQLKLKKWSKTEVAHLNAEPPVVIETKCPGHWPGLLCFVCVNLFTETVSPRAGGWFERIHKNRQLSFFVAI